MIPYATCMCPGRRYRSWVVVGSSSQLHGTAMIQRVPGNSLCISMADTEQEEIKERDERIAAEVISRPVTKRLFQTLHKRRPKHPIITPRIYKLALIDACYNGNTDCLLSHCDEWAFNTFNLDIATGGRSLSTLLVHLFQTYGLVEKFHLDMVKVWRCFSIMEATYHGHNPYHNSVHAADVAQAMNCFLREDKIAAHLTPVEAMSALIAAVGHDLDHPGVNQPFLVATTNHLVQLYQCSSVLENHHWRIAISCLVESGVFEHLSKDDWNDVQWQVRSLILATDITHQPNFLKRFKRHLEAKTLDLKDKDNRHFTLQIALKCADLCNPCRPWLISQRWSHQVCQEFYRQGDYEKQLNLPVTPTFDRSRTTVAKIQSDFFEFIVTPLFETWHKFLDSPLSNQLVYNLNNNHCQWKMKVEQAQGETIPVAGLVIPQTIDIPSSSKRTDLYIPDAQQDFISTEGPAAGNGKETSNLQTPSEELNPTTSVMSLSSQENVLRLQRVTVISEVETYFRKAPVAQKVEEVEEKKECVNGCCTPPFQDDQSKHSDKSSSPSWCWHIIRSLSEERTQQPSKDFDSPAHSLRGSVNNLSPGSNVRDRRGSAPMALGSNHLACLSDVIEACNGITRSGRRWSIPSEPVQGTYNNTSVCKPANKALDGYNITADYEKGSRYSAMQKENLEPESKSVYVSGSPIILSCVAPTVRRGSLPTDLPISMMKASVKADSQQSGIQWNHPRRRSAGELLSVLLGTASALTAIQSVDASMQRTAIGGYQRRGSDGLELVYGFWRTRRLDNKNLESAGQIIAGRYKFPLALDPPSVPNWSPKNEDLRQFYTNYLLPTNHGGHSGISTYSEHLCQRRASVPVGVPALSTNSGSPYRNYRGNMS